MLFALLMASMAAPTEAGRGSPNSLTVEGRASVNTAPNVATYSYRVRGEGKTSEEALRNMVSRGAGIESALKARDSGTILTSEDVKVESVRDPNCGNTDDENDYGERTVMSVGKCTIVGFVAAQNFKGKTGNVREVGTLAGIATTNGALNSTVGSFDLTNEADAKKRAIAAAMEDARRKADALATGARARLGEILSVSLDNANRFESSQDIVVTGAMRTNPNVVQVSMMPEDVETSATVTVTYAIARQ